MMQRLFIGAVILICATSLYAQENLPAELPSVVQAIPEIMNAATHPTPPIPNVPQSVSPKPVVPPQEIGNTKAPPVTEVPPAKPAPTLQGVSNALMDVMKNPDEVRKAIEQAPKNIPQQLQRAKERAENLLANSDRFNGDNFEKLGWRGSLMFPAEELTRLYNAAKGLTDNAVTAATVQVKVPRVAPAFYLSSVLYDGPKNWTIWLNSRRIRYGATFPELVIDKVDRDAVSFIWETDQLDFLSPEWEKKVMPVVLEPGQPVPRFTYRSPDGSIEVDRSRRFVKFTLGPHQSFVSKGMKIVEGFAKSTFFQTTQPGGPPGAPGAAPVAAGAPGQPTAQAPKYGTEAGKQYVPPAAVSPIRSTGLPPINLQPGSPVNQLNPLAPPPAMFQPPVK